MFRLDTCYVDLYMIHSPSGGDILRTYDAMLELKDQRLVSFFLQTYFIFTLSQHFVD